MDLVTGLLLMLALLGHLILWVGAFNKLHALAIPTSVWFVELIEKLIELMVVVIPGALAWLFTQSQQSLSLTTLLQREFWPVLIYATLCWIMVVVCGPAWFFQRRRSDPSVLLSTETDCVNVAERLGHRPVGNFSGRLFAAIPGNESFHLSEQHKTLLIERLPVALDGLTIAHVSDLHFTGRITCDYFDFAIERLNAMQADLIVITGDIIDSHSCLPWVQNTLGKLAAQNGVFYVLGNHDQRSKRAEEVRSILNTCGLINLGGKSLSVTIKGWPIFLAGNELPWFRPAPVIPAATASGSTPRPVRILVSHSPDQIVWAKEHDFDLMLAGHTHGGQIRLPVIGPVVSPSRFGVKYASGLFHEHPTVMHVSRGLSGQHPIRWNCPPEISKLILRSPAVSKSGRDASAG